MNLPSPTAPDLLELIGLFYASPADLGDLASVRAEEIPRAYRELLNHQRHMTVAVERFHGCPVDVRVLESHYDQPNHYCRKITLTRQSDDAIVQFGIVRLHLGKLKPVVRREIEAARIPLGRVLINHQVLRRVHLTALWKATAGQSLAEMLQCRDGAVTYGRTALIYCNEQPAVELLEIVAPLPIVSPADPR